MTYQDDFTLSAALLEQLSTQGLGALPDLFPVLLNAAMQIERQKHLGAAPHERTPERTGYANGYKDKTLNTRLGQITVAVPQVREVNGQRGGFYPQSLERVPLIKPQSRNQTADTGGEYFPEQSVVPAPGECVIDGDQR